jgi:predicted nucleotidyltransferase
VPALASYARELGIEPLSILAQGERTMKDLNPHVRWRLELAGEIAERVRRWDGVRAIIVAGSVARGYADRYSDLELPLFWEAFPDDAVRMAIVADLGAEFLYPYDGPAAEDNLLIHGFQVDLWHCVVASEEVVIAAVLDRYDTDLGSSNFMDTLRWCVPLHGEAIVDRWKEKARQYPDGLVARNLEENLVHLDARHLQINAWRDHPTLLYGQISALQERLFMLLLALNRMYFPTYKWIYRYLAAMHVRPAEVERRFRRAFECPAEEACADMLALIDETLALIDVHWPQIDTSAAKERLAARRVAYDHPVHL